MINLPPIVDADIDWACRVMNLPPTAFTGADGNDPRAGVIKRMDTVDVEACPGSGKTTLLVAKLAILARHWPTSRAGICVLSHTNAARNEITKKLGSTAEGQGLLRYPHFVGTIHSFVNEYLAFPYLRSKGKPIKVIDTAITKRHRWYKIPAGTRYHLEKKFGHTADDNVCEYRRPDYGGGDLSALGEHTPTFAQLKEICRETSEEGYYCFHEMFVWGRQLLDDHPEVVSDLRRRFPLVFIDEVQDNDEDQSSLIHRIFMEGNSPAIRQRFGDSNQAIFHSIAAEAARTDIFPAAGKVDLPNSFRFGERIANLAKPLGVMPQELVGLEPEQKPPVIFLFDDQSIQEVLPAYGRYLMATFTDAELGRGPITAIAGVHYVGEANDKLPRRLGHYAPDYDPIVANRSAVPTTFCGHLRSGYKEGRELGQTQPVVMRTALGLLQLLQMDGSDVWPAGIRRPHQAILEKLATLDGREAYLSLQSYLVENGGTLDSDNWQGTVIPHIEAVFQHLTGHAVPAGLRAYLTWDPDLSAEEGKELERGTNLFKFEEGGRSLSIRLGSIHSVKGETHLATLVLDSYYYDHHLKALKPWLLGTSVGGKGKSTRLLTRLRLHYVGMTRPSHLLCLAMRRDSLEEAEQAALIARGWSLEVCPGTAA